MRWLPFFALSSLPLLGCWPSESASTSATVGESSTTSTGETTGLTTGETTGETNSTGETVGETVGETAGVPPKFWPGEVCEPAAEEKTGPAKVYFDLDAGTEPGLDFFRLPFPIDSRLKGGGIDLDGFPRPPADIDPIYGAVVERWLKHLRGETPGFAVNGATLFRSNYGISDFGDGGIHYIDISHESPNYGQEALGIRYRAENGSISRNNYICPNWLAVERSDGAPLRPATTYAVLLTTALKPAGADHFVADDDFKAMLSDAQPADSAQFAAWQDFAPLREFLTSPENINNDGPQLNKSELIGGTVFTTAPNLDPLIGAREVIDAAPFLISELHLCEGPGDSPCSIAPGLSAEEQDKRRCGESSADYYEIHGRLRIPIFQEGIAPYSSVGGAIDIDDAGPVIRSTRDTCFSATIPKDSELPEGGWPVLIYADGTSGSFRGAIRNGLAQEVAARGIATLSLEPVLHGERRGDDDSDGLVEGLDVYQLVFNVFNPDSARDTVVQGALDQFSLVRLSEHWTDDTLLDGQSIRFDSEAIAFAGHSLGANSGSLFLPFAPTVRAAVISGGGSNLPQALLAKQEPKIQNPVTMAWMTPIELLQVAFQERPDRMITSYHPMLLLLNTYVNRSDADNTSRHLRREPLGSLAAKHLLLYIGHLDSYTPLRAAGSLAIGAGTEIAEATLFPVPCDDYSDDAERMACGYTKSDLLRLTDLPASANLGGETAIVRMLQQPPGKDGHFVLFQPAELKRAAAFIASALSDEGAPTVP